MDRLKIREAIQGAYANGCLYRADSPARRSLEQEEASANPEISYVRRRKEVQGIRKQIEPQSSQHIISLAREQDS